MERYPQSQPCSTPTCILTTRTTEKDKNSPARLNRDELDSAVPEALSTFFCFRKLGGMGKGSREVTDNNDVDAIEVTARWSVSLASRGRASVRSRAFPLNRSEN